MAAILAAMLDFFKIFFLICTLRTRALRALGTRVLRTLGSGAARPRSRPLRGLGCNTTDGRTDGLTDTATL